MANGGEDGGVKGRDPAWKYCESLPTNKQATICKFCQLTLMSGGITRFKYHLSHTDPQKNARPCKNVPPEVKKEIRDQLRAKEIQKRKKAPIYDDIKAELQRGLHPNEEDDDDDDNKFVYPPGLDYSERRANRSAIIQSRAIEWGREQTQNSEGRTRGRRGNASEPPPHYHVPQFKNGFDDQDAITSERTPIRVPEAGNGSIPHLVPAEGSVDLIIREDEIRSPIVPPPAKRSRTDIVDVATLSEALCELAEASKRLVPLAEEQALRAESAEERIARVEKELAAERQKRKEAEDEAAKAKAEVKDLKKEKSMLRKSEGEILSTFLAKLLTTNTFSQFIQQCAVPLMENARAELLQKIRKDFPDLPRLDEKSEPFVPTDEELNHLRNNEDRDKDSDSIQEQLSAAEKHASASAIPAESDIDTKVSGSGHPTEKEVS